MPQYRSRTTTHGRNMAGARALQEAGVTDADIARVHSPVGADIGAASPAEIAVSIMAEVTAARHQVATGTVAPVAAIPTSAE